MKRAKKERDSRLRGNDDGGHWIPAFAGLRRQDAEANIRVANGPKGELRMPRAMTSKNQDTEFCLHQNVIRRSRH
jgi:hypothetical protein